MKLNLFVAFAAFAFGSSLVLAAPVNLDTQDLAAREPTYEVEDFIARDFADVDEFDAREYFDEGLVEAREDEQEDVFARSPQRGGGVLRRRRCGTRTRSPPSDLEAREDEQEDIFARGRRDGGRRRRVKKVLKHSPVVVDPTPPVGYTSGGLVF